ncbi:FtsK/SpoIIIE domain-containing protein [Streptomyces virginiae]|uniref:FtsK/SpoIIIE domain-containing protein n=1 Tax=Streptomyces virginiae TaxID=1961 RepID=UPI00386F6BA4|nr:FtsK/SpoIIIE domain-containing protein [Streptomyces virginiae]
MPANTLSTGSLLIASLGVLGVLAWAGFCFVRWYRADDETRISLRQARRIRWGWKRLAPMLDLAVKDATPTVLQQVGTQETPAKPRALAPRLHTQADPFGVTVTADALPQVGLSAWQDASEGLRDAWGMRRIRISQAKPGVIVARGFRREPLEAVIRSPLLGPDGSPACRPGQFVSTDDVLLGWDEDGTPIVLNLANSAHALIAGVTRSGKSITVNTLLAYASLMRDVRLIVIDPNLGAVAPWWRTAYKVSDSIHPDEPTEILRWVREEMRRRERMFWSGRTDRITNFSPDMPLLVLAIDEVANYTRHPDRKARERFEAELLAIASQGAKFGLRLWLLTQKPSADVLTTAVRTNLSARICHRVDTTEDFLHLFPDGRELDITAADREMPPGVSIASVGDMRTPVRLRSVYLPTEACWQINDLMCADGLQVRELPNHVDLGKAA